MDIKEKPNIEIINLPTDIRYLNQLSNELDGPRLYIKRDNLSDSSFKARKLRSLELFMSDAVHIGAKYIIISGDLMSSYICLAVCTAVRFGLKPIVVTTSKSHVPNNYYLSKESFDAELHFIPLDENDSEQVAIKKRNDKMREIRDTLDRKGIISYVIPSNIEESLASVCDIVNIAKKVKQENFKINYIVKAVDSTSTFGVIVLKAKLFQTGLTPIGISVTNKANKERRETLHSVADFGFDLNIKDEEVNIFNSTSSTYEYPKELGVKAIKLLADTEAIFLDHYYNGKALAGLFTLIKQKYFQKEDGVLFLHSGEMPALSALENTE